MYLAFLFLMTVSAIITKARGKEVQIDNFVNSFSGKINKNGLITSFTTRSKLQCASSCSTTENCVSFFFIKNESQCNLHNCVLRDSSIGNEDHAISKYYSTNKPCPEGLGYTYNVSLNLCYKIFCDPVETYMVAVNTCASDCGHLIMIQNQEIHMFVSYLIRSCANYSLVRAFYVDGSDAYNEGQWTFFNGDSIMWTHWMPWQPNNNSYVPGGEDYLELQEGPSKGEFLWNDIAHDRWPGGFICQIDI